jgi:hypothetical protein
VGLLASGTKPFATWHEDRLMLFKILVLLGQHSFLSFLCLCIPRGLPNLEIITCALSARKATNWQSLHFKGDALRGIRTVEQRSLIALQRVGSLMAVIFDNSCSYYGFYGNDDNNNYYCKYYGDNNAVNLLLILRPYKSSFTYEFTQHSKCHLRSKHKQIRKHNKHLAHTTISKDDEQHH